MRNRLSSGRIEPRRHGGTEANSTPAHIRGTWASDCPKFGTRQARQDAKGAKRKTCFHLYWRSWPLGGLGANNAAAKRRGSRGAPPRLRAPVVQRRSTSGTGGA